MLFGVSCSPTGCFQCCAAEPSPRGPESQRGSLGLAARGRWVSTKYWGLFPVLRGMMQVAAGVSGGVAVVAGCRVCACLSLCGSFSARLAGVSLVGPSPGVPFGRYMRTWTVVGDLC